EDRDGVLPGPAADAVERVPEAAARDRGAAGPTEGAAHADRAARAPRRRARFARTPPAGARIQTGESIDEIEARDIRGRVVACASRRRHAAEDAELPVTPHQLRQRADRRAGADDLQSLHRAHRRPGAVVGDAAFG